MMKKTLIALLTTVALSTSACAGEEQSSVTKTAQTAVKTASATMSPGLNAPEEAWRDLDPENTLYIDLEYGRVVIELYPEIAPLHVAQIKTLARQGFYDLITFHRVIDGFMNQTGDPKGDGSGDSQLPDIQGEFTFRRPPTMPVTLVGARSQGGKEVGVGFYKALPVATQPSSQAMLTKDGKVAAFGLHCKGVTSMARTSDPNSANSQFFLMRDIAQHLDAQYSIWGNTVLGHEHLTKIKVGSKGENPDFVPDVMKKVQLAADVAESDRVKLQVLKTDSPAFKNYLKTKKKADGTYPDICDIRVPTRQQ
ncbi:peptidylprolyl isomerase [Hellea balneolensis]|uniref:peptidylprolyl isomerase n=1 Tax=Hellea balneolensis TaxID=287478 RepID=UPI00041FFE5E|nr:peptidylprolyl isomerase [Hellea balneolensis]